MSTQKEGTGIIHEHEKTKRVLGRILSSIKSQRQESGMYFRNFRHFSNEERVETGNEVGFLS